MPYPTFEDRYDPEVSTVLAMTKRSAVVRGEIFSDGRLVCAAQGTLTIVDPKPQG